MEKVTCLDTSKPGKEYVLPEEELEQKMKTEVEPYLQSIVRGGYQPEKNGLYYELYPLTDNRGTIVISFGFTESCTKYHELIYYFLRKGYQTAVLDHRGHGKSLREAEEHCVVHVERFEQYVEDLHDFLHNIVIPWAGETVLYLYGHSMGGCIAARYLECYPDDFTKAVLNAPMLGVELGTCPSWAAVLLCDLNILVGRGKRRLFSHKEYNPEDPFSHSSASSEMRHNYYRAIRRREISYQTSAASYRWAREAIRGGKKAIRTGEARKVAIPVLLFQAGEDTTVSPGAQRKFVGRAPHARMIIVPGVRHEIYRAGNQVLSNYLDELYSFFS